MMKKNLSAFLLLSLRWVCPIFTTLVLMLTLINVWFYEAGSVAFSFLLQPFVQSVIPSVLSCLAYSDLVIHRGSAVLRNFVFFGLLAAQTASAGWIFGWFQGLHSILWSALIAVAICLVLSGFAMLSEKARSNQYQQGLEAYQKEHGGRA